MEEKYYETLGLVKGAEKKDIKRAYFRLVRQYTPEKDPERFQQIREAYEYLSNLQEAGEQPVFPPFSDPFGEKMERQILEAEKNGNLELACDTCEEACKFFPEDLRFLYQLTVLQRRTGRTGKAVKSAKLLVEKEKDNKWFYRELALSNMERGYTNKAYNAFYRAYELGIRDTDFLTLYARECYEFGQYRRGISLIKDIFRQKKRFGDDIPELIDLMMTLLDMTICIEEDSVSEVISLITNMVNANREVFPEYAAELYTYINVFEKNYDEDGSWHSEYITLARLLLSLKEEAPSSSEGDKDEDIITSLGMLQNDPLLDEYWLSLAELRVFGKAEDHMSAYEFKFNETERMLFLLKRREETLTQVSRIKELYPEVYELLKDFIEVLSDKQKSEQKKKGLLDFYRKNLPHMNGEPWYFNAYPEERFDSSVKLIADGADGTFVREQKKIGRNDPCPCGSGKKYKQCCMNKDRR